MTQRRVRTPQGFGGCALRRRLRQCSLNKERLLCFLLQQNRSSALNRTHPVGHQNKRTQKCVLFGSFGEGCPRRSYQKKRGVAPFYFGDIVGVRTPQGFGGCALRRRLRQCSLNKECLLCFLLQQNRSSTLNRTHPVGHLPPRYFGGASLAKAPKPSAAPFYFGDIVGVRTPEGFGDFGKTALNGRKGRRGGRAAHSCTQTSLSRSADRRAGRRRGKPRPAPASSRGRCGTPSFCFRPKFSGTS